jgi:hypothetical protein
VISLKSDTAEVIEVEGFEILNTVLFILFLSECKDNPKNNHDQSKDLNNCQVQRRALSTHPAENNWVTLN